MGSGGGVENLIPHSRLICVFRFLLASLNIDGVLQESTVYRRRQRLSQLTDGLGLGGVYDATIERIKAQGGDKSRLGIGALMWISHAERPLREDELCHALGIELGSTDFNADNIPSIKTLIGCCQGLIMVDKEASTVRLVHFTLKEYLSAHPDIFGSPHSTIAEICLTYLNSQQVRALLDDPNFDPNPDIYCPEPFLDYCCLYWGVHAKKELSDYGRSLALEMLQEYGDHISAVYLTWHLGGLEDSDFDVCYASLQFSGLHCASYFGIVEVVAALLEMQGYGIDERYCWASPLAWAARYRHEEVVKMLLGREEVNPDEPNAHGQTPLSYAAAEGNEEVVKILLGREDVNPDRPDNDGRTPLLYAAENGRAGVVKILLGREVVNPDCPDNRSRTPLSYAAAEGNEEVVKILLGREDVNPDCPDNGGRTPLSYAAGARFCSMDKEYAGVVKILLGRAEVNPERPDNSGRTPLSYAAQGVMEILLGQEEVNPDCPDNDGRTPLSYVAQEGRREAVNMLLGREEVNPDCPDNDGRTPLSYAAGGSLWSMDKKCAGVVKILLGRAEVNPERPDNSGRTPLSYATQKGYGDVMEILLGQEEVNPDCPDNDGRTPLSYAVAIGSTIWNIERYAGVVEMLLERAEVILERPDNCGRTPFSYATSEGHEEVVKILLGRCLVDLANSL